MVKTINLPTWLMVEADLLRSLVPKRKGGDSDDNMTWAEVAARMNEVLNSLPSATLVGLPSTYLGARVYTADDVRRQWAMYKKSEDYAEVTVLTT
jgi:hypothetical protein